MDIRILSVREEDAQFLSAVMNDTSILEALKEVPTHVDDWIDAIATWKSDPDEEDYIIYDGKIPIGWLGINGLMSEDKTAYIKTIALLPQFQNRGAGTHVVGHCVDDLRSRHFQKVMLYTDQDNDRAQKCYKKCGFNVTEELTEKMSNGAIVKRYKMELPINL